MLRLLGYLGVGEGYTPQQTAAMQQCPPPPIYSRMTSQQPPRPAGIGETYRCVEAPGSSPGNITWKCAFVKTGCPSPFGGAGASAGSGYGLPPSYGVPSGTILKVT